MADNVILVHLIQLPQISRLQMCQVLQQLRIIKQVQVVPQPLRQVQRRLNRQQIMDFRKK